MGRNASHAKYIRPPEYLYSQPNQPHNESVSLPLIVVSAAARLPDQGGCFNLRFSFCLIQTSSSDHVLISSNVYTFVILLFQQQGGWSNLRLYFCFIQSSPSDLILTCIHHQMFILLFYAAATVTSFVLIYSLPQSSPI